MVKHSGSFLRSFVKFTGLVALFAALNSCSVHQNTRQLAPSFSDSSVKKLRSFHVRKHGDDDYKLGEEIAAQLKQMGYKASVGSTEKSSAGVDAVITYTDKWAWDITTYLLSLDIQIRDPRSDSVLVTAKTVRTSLVRKPQQEVVRETLNKLLKDL